MSRSAFGLVTAVLVLVAATTATAASTNKSVTPKLGSYVGGPEYATGRAAGVKVVKIGKRRGAEFGVSIPGSCTYSNGTGESHIVFHRVEETPIPIKNGKFAFDRTFHGPATGGAGTETERLVVTGTFKSATTVLVKASANLSANVQFPEQPNVKETCNGKQTITAKHQ